MANLKHPELGAPKRRFGLLFRGSKGDGALDTVGAELRAARLKKGEELDHVSAKLKIRKDILQSLEDSDYARHPPKVYAIGFVRAYADYLGLDGQGMVKRYKSEIAGRATDRAPELNFPTSNEDRGFSGLVAILAIVVTGGLGYGAWTLSRMPDQTGAPVVVTEQEAQALAEEQAAKAPAPLGLPADPLLFAQQMAAPAAQAPKIYGDIDGITRITLKATEDCYVRVRDLWSDGGPKVIFEQTLKKGESYKVPNRGGLWLRAGNAGALIVEIDGISVGALGRPGDTADRVSLTVPKLVARVEDASAPPRPRPAEPPPVQTPAPAPPSGAQPNPGVMKPVE